MPGVGHDHIRGRRNRNWRPPFRRLTPAAPRSSAVCTASWEDLVSCAASAARNADAENRDAGAHAFQSGHQPGLGSGAAVAVTRVSISSPRLLACSTSSSAQGDVAERTDRVRAAARNDVGLAPIGAQPLGSCGHRLVHVGAGRHLGQLRAEQLVEEDVPRLAIVVVPVARPVFEDQVTLQAELRRNRRGLPRVGSTASRPA